MVKCWGIFKLGNIELPRDSSPLRAPSTSESILSLPKRDGFEIIGSSRDGWSSARVRAADAECWAFQRAARQATTVGSAALAKDYKGLEPRATDKDTRIYTKLKDGKYRYWGVKDLDETMEEFWARIDPDNKRERIVNQDSSPLPAPAKFTPSKSPSPRPRTASRSERRQETLEDPKYRVTKPAIATPASKKGIPESLAGNIEVRDSETDEQNQNISNSSMEEHTFVMNPFGTRWPDKAERSQTISAANSSTSNPSITKTVARGRPRKIQSGLVNPASSEAADWSSSTREVPPKRKRGRPAKEKYPTKSRGLHRSCVSNEKQKRPKAERKAKVTKPELENARPIAPSFHKMRTRARGPAEHLQRF